MRFIDRNDMHYICRAIMFNDNDEPLALFEIMNRSDRRFIRLIHDGKWIALSLIISAGACYGLSFLGLPLGRLLLIALPVVLLIGLLWSEYNENSTMKRSLEHMYAPLTDGYEMRHVYEVLPDAELYVKQGDIYAFKFGGWKLDHSVDTIAMDKTHEEFRHIVFLAMDQPATYDAFEKMEYAEEQKKRREQDNQNRY